MAQAIVQRACAKLRSAIGDEAVARLIYTSYLHDILEALEVIQPVLDKAEMWPLRDKSASQWLWVVRATAYKIMDMVDELEGTRSPAAAAMTRMLPGLAIKNKAIAIKVNETKKTLTGLKDKMHLFDSVEEDAVSQEVTDERITGPFFKEALVFGRGLDKRRIMAVLLSAASNISQGSPSCTILPIFGIAGSGKTTLAQMVFNDTHSLQKYNFRIWVHVSPKLNFHGIGESILSQVLSPKQKILCQVVSGLGGHEEKQINDHGSNSDMVGMWRIMKHLHELLKDTKVLLVLDDLWEEDPIQLQLLKDMLTSLGHKMDVVVTTCNKAIARNICTIEPYMLNPLDDGTCWEIIKKSIRLEEEDGELEKIGQEIARKCWGVPSVARAYASMLDSRDPTKWKEVMERNIWKNISSFRLSILLMLSTFELSYTSMPPDLRLCFAYCAIFSNGHKIVKDDLIHQWIALHLIEPSERLSTAQTAEEYITKLIDMSFLQTAKSNTVCGKDDKGAIMFTMHGLAHEFARWFALLENIYEDNIPIRHVPYRLIINWSGELDDEYDDYLRALRCVTCSKVKFNNDSFSFRRCLRVLELEESSVKELPESICQLRHLGYLKISAFSGLVALPESFGRLINMFHIDLSGCFGLVNLPESFGNLIHLVHIDLSGCSELVTLPESFGKLVNVLHINLSGCSGLLNLPESFGKLLKLVHINLSGCSGLATLPGSFDNLKSLSHIDLSHCHGLEILETLQKLNKLVYLDLSFWSCFQGIRNCLGGLTNLQHLSLSNPCCYLDQHQSHLQELKDVMGKLTKLRYLNLSMFLNPIFYYQTGEENVKYVETCIGGLTNLEHLDLSHNIYLVDLPECLGDLNKLHTLDLSGCLRLKRLGKRIGEMRSLKLIVLKNCRELETCHFMVRVDDGPYNSSTNLVELEVVDCEELEISCLEKVKSLEEAQRIRLVEKENLKRLKLCWTVGTVQGSWEVDENALLGELVPPHTLQSLELRGYTAEACLPGWWTRSICSSILLNIVEVTMVDFPRCVILPQLGLLPNLKILVLRRMGSVTRIDDIDLSGGNREAFSQLSKVTIEDMEKLKVFMLPGVAELVIQKCPQLSFGPLPPRAQRLVISDCNKVMSSWGERQGDGDEASSSSTPVTELVVETYNLPLDDSGLLHHLPGLNSLTIKNSHGLLSLPEYLSDLTSLRELTIQSCHGMESLLQSMDKLTNLKDLYILDCPGLKKWCESEENKTKLAHIQPKYEKEDTSRTGDQQLDMQTNLAASGLAQGAERALATRRSLRRQATRL